MIEKPNCQGNTKLMTPQLEKIYKAEKFIQHLICDELKKLIYNSSVSPYSKFLVLPQYIEFLGACIDEKPFNDLNLSPIRFNKVMKQHFQKKNTKYWSYSNGNDSQFDLYEHFRCSVVHQLRPMNGIKFTTREEAKKSDNKHLYIDSKYNEYLILVLEDMYDDIAWVASQIIDKYKNNEFSRKIMDKWDENYIEVINSEHE